MSVRYVLRPQIINHQATGRFRLVSLRSKTPGIGHNRPSRLTAGMSLLIIGIVSLMLWMVILAVVA
ncbi:MAG TPA: hypothetical protein VF649_01980 [Sphingomonas sp.]|jgi:hypothetical protein|uniref:hypothetical protein n=1 Tax=Sphingomonas sp. TaxID=28214 RepID=UPI002ED7F623